MDTYEYTEQFNKLIQEVNREIYRINLEHLKMEYRKALHWCYQKKYNLPYIYELIQKRYHE